MFRFWRLLSLIIHLLYGFVVAAVFWPLLGPRLRVWMERHFARRLMAVLHVQVQAHYEQPQSNYAEHGPCLIYSNHVSWLDIFAFNSLSPVTFIAKSEISNWPIGGVLAKRSGTLFIERGKRHAVRDVIEAAVKRLQTGRTVAVFPEGTTGPGDQPLHFHSNFVQPAIHAGVPLQPVSLQYFDAQGRFSAAPAFIGEQTLVENVKVLLSAPQGFIVKLHFHAPILPQPGQTRHALSDEAFATIAAHCKKAAS